VTVAKTYDSDLHGHARQRMSPGAGKSAKLSAPARSPGSR
jgi:hypothetical protein